MPPNRIVALVTPLAALAAGACATWLARHFPGIDIKQSDLQSVFIAGAVAVLAPSVQWQHGWQKHEAREADTANAIKLSALAAPPVVNASEEEEPDGPVGPEEFDPIDEDLDDLSALDDFDDVPSDEGDQLTQTAG